MADSTSQPGNEEYEQRKALARRVTKTIRDLGSSPDDEIEEKVLAVVAQSEFSGPLPPPEAFLGYQEVLPDAPDRILRMAEKEQDMRREAMRGTIGNDRSRIAGSIIISLAVIGLAGFALFLGHPWVAVPLGMTGILGALIRIIQDMLSRQSN